METSILTSTKKILGLAEDYTAFDLDVITHINAAFGVLHDLGVGPPAGVVITDDTAQWSDLRIPPVMLNIVQSYIYLKTRMLFDPPTTSFHIEAMNEQINQFEWRLREKNDEYAQTEEVVP